MRFLELRTSSHFTQKDVAAKLDIAQSTYSMYEQEKVSVRGEVLVKLSKLYGVTVDYLLGLENVHKTNESKEEHR